eukprot:2179316-Pyramimonas_sp.AAC.1
MGTILSLWHSIGRPWGLFSVSGILLVAWCAAADLRGRSGSRVTQESAEHRHRRVLTKVGKHGYGHIWGVECLIAVIGTAGPVK